MIHSDKTSIKILIVDDSETDRWLFRHYLTNNPTYNYDVLEAKNIHQGLEIWRSHKPDVVLVDFNLVGETGLQFLESLHEEIQAENLENGEEKILELKLPVIVLTGHGDDKMAVQSMKLGAADYLVKNDVTDFSLHQSILSVRDYFAVRQKLAQSQKRESVVSQIALGIRQSLNLYDICLTVTQESRKFLKTDRMVIYKFNDDMSRRIIAEDFGEPWQSCGELVNECNCFQLSDQVAQEYQNGKILVANDVLKANFAECHVQMLQRFQVRANIVVPILVVDASANNLGEENLAPSGLKDINREHQHKLWGLIIAHQCSATRNWEDWDIQFLQQLSVNLAIAVHQAEIHHDLHRLNASLEQQVQTRTQDLRTSEQKLSSILNSLPDIINLISHDGIYLESKRDNRLYDLIPETINPVGKHIYELLPEHIAHRQMQAIHQAIATREIQCFEQIYQVDHLYYYEEVRIVAIRDDAAIVIVRDVSDRRRAEESLNIAVEALQKSEEQRRLAIDLNHIGCWDFDVKTGLAIWNENHHRIMGLEPDQAESGYATWRDRVHPDDLDWVETAINTALENHSMLEVEYQIIHPSGEIHWVLSKGRGIYDDLSNKPVRMVGVILDISDRKNVELALEKEFIRNKTLFNSSFDGIYILDSAGKFIEVNQSYANILGYSINEMLNLSIYDIDVKWTKDELDTGLAEFKKQKKVMFETQHRRKDGSICHVEISATSVDWDNDIVQFGICRDVSNRKLAEAKLQKQQQELQTLVENIPDVVARFDRDLRRIYINPVIESIRGISAEELIGKSPEEVPLPNALLEALHKVLESGQQEIIDFAYDSISGLRYFQSRLVPEFDANGEIISILSISRDFTEQKVAEQALQYRVEREQLLNLFIQVMRSSLDLKVVFRSATDAIARLLDLEQVAIVQYLPERKVWKHVAVLKESPEVFDDISLEIPDLDNPFAAKLKQKEIVQIIDAEAIEDKINREIATKASGAWLLVPIIVNNQVWGSLSSRKLNKVTQWEAQEIDLAQTIANQLAIAIQQANLYQQLQQELSERKQTEIALAQAKEVAEAASKAKSEFLANMSHEIRTPMNGVIGMAQLIASTPLREDQRKFVQIILDSGDALLTVINDILDFSKIESGNLQLESKDFHIIEIITSAFNLLKQQAVDKNIQIHMQISPQIPHFVIGDKSRLRQILINLLGNAIKFTNQGTVILKVDGQFISDTIYKFKFAIADTGIGIEKNHITKLFRPFTQADASISRQFGGTGLGLAICKRLIELMNGTIWAESSGNIGGIPDTKWIPQNTTQDGTTFYFNIILPITIHQPTSQNSLNITVSNSILNPEESPVKILVVEDNTLNQKLAILMLQKLGYKADLVGDGSECVNLILNQDSGLAYEFIFMDLQMPIMDGISATRLIRSRLGSPDKPWIVALTADVLMEERQACIDVGMNDYISKPFSAKDLVRAISEYLRVKSQR
ncbi:PAS domain S-box protein [Pseudanabaena sp. FACHB-1998]|uniref:PAS domain S-box protein n=1 Tax=Pseudanabaena sp. FACHB-1998 TaxID=2692858 RepID=UPI001680BD9A|nr:PAS domain S-box protein [Pseudanabaena sp. FACHB-1998]MBD2175638.1 PAS domain S-box protein [Pseudanabaena sp. FACHB-1998]